MSPKGPRGNFKTSICQSLNGFNLLFPLEWEDWEYEGCHRWRFPLFGISSGHPQTPVKPPKRAWLPFRLKHGESIGAVAGGTWDQHHSRLSHSHTVKMGPAITAEDILRSISSSNREPRPGQMEGRYSSTRLRLASLSSDHFLWHETE